MEGEGQRGSNHRQKEMREERKIRIWPSYEGQRKSAMELAEKIVMKRRPT